MHGDESRDLNTGIVCTQGFVSNGASTISVQLTYPMTNDSRYQSLFAAITAVIYLIHGSLPLGDAIGTIVVPSLNRADLKTPAEVITVTGNNNVVINNAGNASVVLHGGGANQTEELVALREGVAKLESDNSLMRQRLSTAENKVNRFLSCQEQRKSYNQQLDECQSLIPNCTRPGDLITWDDASMSFQCSSSLLDIITTLQCNFEGRQRQNPWFDLP